LVNWLTPDIGNYAKMVISSYTAGFHCLIYNFRGDGPNLGLKQGSFAAAVLTQQFFNFFVEMPSEVLEKAILGNLFSVVPNSPTGNQNVVN
jgi:hypothetical protein